MPTPQFKNTIIEDMQAQVSVYVGAVKVQSKQDPKKRMHLRIVEKPASVGPGVLFVFKKLTLQVQAKTFEQLIQVPAVQAWFLECCKQVLEEKFASEL